jgi:hypothetical protein
MPARPASPASPPRSASLAERLRNSPAAQSAWARRLRRARAAYPGRLGVCAVAAGAAFGGFITLLAGSAPGPVLGVFLVIATVAATLAVRPGDAYMIIPVPALAYVVAALTVGLIETYDQPGATSLTSLAVNVLQWIAGGFLAMAIATVVTLAGAAIHWRGSRAA